MAENDDVKEQAEKEEVQKPEEKEEVKEQEKNDGADKQETSKEKQEDKKESKNNRLQWIILASVVVFCAGTGFGLGRILAGPDKKPDSAARLPATGTNHTEDLLDLTGRKPEKAWYYDLEPVVANLDEPGVTRYIRVALTLEINSEVDEKKGIAYLEKKMPLITNWLTIYLAGLSIEDIRGNRNLKRIQSQILNAFNETLFPDSKPQIKHILFKEFAIQ